MVACSRAAWPPPAPPEFVNPVKATPQPWALHWAGTLGVGGGKIQEFLTRKIPNMEKWNGEEYLLFSMRKENVLSKVLCDTTRSHHEAWRGWRERSMTQTGCSIAKLGATRSQHHISPHSAPSYSYRCYYVCSHSIKYHIDKVRLQQSIPSTSLSLV